MMPRQTLLHVHALYHMHQHNIKASWQPRVRVAKTPFRWHVTHASAPSCVVVADEFQWRDATAFRVGAVNIRSLIEHNFQLDPDIIMALLLPIGSGLRLGLDVVSYRSSNSPSRFFDGEVLQARPMISTIATCGRRLLMFLPASLSRNTLGRRLFGDRSPNLELEAKRKDTRHKFRQIRAARIA